MRAGTQQRDPHPEVRSVDVSPGQHGANKVEIHTSRGMVEGRLNTAPSATGGVVMVGGVGGGFNGPASVYPDLSEELRRVGISSLRLDFRNSRSLAASVHDVLAGVEALAQLGVERVVLIGWSFGGAVVISAGALSDRVVGAATVASQSHGTDAAPALSPRPLLLLHGTGDNTLTPLCSQEIYRRAGEPKEISIYPGANHGLDQVRDQMLERLMEWVVRVLGTAGGEP